MKHIAFIMDGNGRYAKSIGKTRSYGHKVGFENMISIIKFLKDTDIKYASFYAFSTENWNRPSEEVSFLMDIPGKISKESLDELIKYNVKVNFLGLRTRIPVKTLKAIENIEKSTINNTGLIVNIMFDYGSRQELVDAFNNIKSLNCEININDLLNSLYTKGIPDVDLLIRTGGEYRLSNFMLLQIAYAELFFTDTYWPEFNAEELKSIIYQYQGRDRRFGGIK